MATEAEVLKQVKAALASVQKAAGKACWFEDGVWEKIDEARTALQGAQYILEGEGGV